MRSQVGGRHGDSGDHEQAENWKTAKYFAPLFGHGSVRLARRLLGTGATLVPGDARLELFWRGVRDHIHQQGGSSSSNWADDFANGYQRLFPDLRSAVEAYAHAGNFQDPTSDNYRATTSHQRSGLESNLRNTEIDIVLESPDHLFIGEAKHETSFHASSRAVLTHQLIRQYVTARVLIDLLGLEKTVIPFVVGDRPTELSKQHQVQFMLVQGWMQPQNVLEWSDIEALW